MVRFSEKQQFLDFLETFSGNFRTNPFLEFLVDWEALMKPRLTNLDKFARVEFVILTEIFAFSFFFGFPRKREKSLFQWPFTWNF